MDVPAISLNYALFAKTDSKTIFDVFPEIY